MTRTQRRRFLRKNSHTRQGQYTSTPGKEMGTFRMNESLQANIKVDNSMTTGLKVTVLDKGKQVHAQNDNTVQEGMDCTEENMLEDEHPNPKFSREKRDEDEDGQGATTTLCFGSLPPVVVANYILPIVFSVLG
ncbi:hypothetical protein LINGRAPRIM_LOCUS10 [Linum grandiflorum]